MLLAALKRREPLMRVSRNPLERPMPMQVAPVGVTIASLQPDAPGLLVCVLNGAPLPRLTARQRAVWRRKLATDVREADRYMRKAARRALVWHTTRTKLGDVIEWHSQPQEKQIAQIIIIVAAIVYGVVTEDWVGAFKFATYALAAVNFLLPPTVPDRLAEDQGKDLFSTSLNGNQARLDEPIWRNFGRVKITPPFAAYPYYEYLDLDGDNLENDQFYYAVFAVGIGDHDLESAMIGRTPITHFQDIQAATYLPPGTLPSIARCNVVTSTEVSTALELESGRYVGGYAACQPRRRAGAVAVDIMCPQGLGKNGDPLSVSVQIEVRDINAFGVAVTPWYVIGTETHTASTNTPQRWSHKYQIGSVASTNPTTGDFEIVPGTGRRVEVRVIRTDLKDTDSVARHSLQWIGLRAYLDEPAPLDPDTAHFEVVMRASEQLSSQSQRDFSLIVWPLVRTWAPLTGWSAPQRTRNPAWALADLWTHPVWGEGLPDARIDLQGLYEWSLTCDARQDRFDFSFSTSMSAWDAGQTIARAGRARVFRRYGVKTLARDELQELPMTALTSANTIAGSMTINEKLPSRESPDGIVAQYRSNITWDDAFIECPAPGFTVTDPEDPRYDAALTPMSNPVYKQYPGVTGAKHAEREGVYDAADLVLRTRTVKCTTEMMGVITSYMMPVLFQPDVPGYGQTGDVAFWDADTLVMGLSEKVSFGISGASYLTLVRDDGSITDPVLVTPGPTPFDLTLPAAPDFELVLDSGTRMRPKFVLGDMDMLVKVASISDGGTSDAGDGEQGAQLYDITAVVDDERVHLADRHLLPGPGEIQDPVDPGVPVDGSDFYGVVTLRDHRIQAGQGVAGGGFSASFTLFNDGTAQGHVEESGPSSADFPYPGEWLLVPVELAQADLYEVYASGTGGAFSGSALETWLPLGTTQTWTCGDTGRGTAVLRLQIRKVDDTIIQADRKIYLSVFLDDLGAGGA